MGSDFPNHRKFLKIKNNCKVLNIKSSFFIILIIKVNIDIFIRFLDGSENPNLPKKETCVTINGLVSKIAYVIIY